MLFDLLEHEGLALGPSSGVNVAGAIRLAKDIGPGPQHRHDPLRQRLALSEQGFQCRLPARKEPARCPAGWWSEESHDGTAVSRRRLRQELRGAVVSVSTRKAFAWTARCSIPEGGGQPGDRRRAAPGRRPRDRGGRHQEGRRSRRRAAPPRPRAAPRRHPATRSPPRSIGSGATATCACTPACTCSAPSSKAT